MGAVVFLVGCLSTEFLKADRFITHKVY